MIECLTGKLIHIETETIIVNVGGVGYLVYCGNPYRFQEYYDNEVTVFTYQHVKEDAIRLYGFKQREERRLFEKMLQVSGIGPKGALAIVTSEQPGSVVDAIEQANESFLTKFPGVGKKTAQQMILDLRGKLGELLPSLTGDLLQGDQPVYQHAAAENEALEEALEALRALGYVDKEIRKIKPVLEAQPSLSTDAYIKQALQEMLKQ
ncbi:Holliday junction branch migration protein RuvA [Salisediminibacterium halotolerans]|uniref:Holliday junction branch migration complex subunit RuvA n=1 Tax=Salisediminibacterium halotolerans TaxID=517425 RepID=A0A1H9VBN0_9BACI|nr:MULTISPECIES: Holliday junction branch migration protein RuvA [Salisediminibacterium]RLJ78393.1 Holliday junction DNA helicase subunit RuvA [Actinophytocola xinjiangensis]RPE88265.1 Holliday junction DNA helicase subunit RuvA [Salisediminibacterium halotolerans]TWG37369.1 Holliday junction DNA helicase subunit RuvA [Salisediminibacterium halotolerans]SES19166.1 holliday junction DNA helicase RuvA [Salisediminibacterium haloalkalitolerans]GEL06834.1 Holliday junction ATP-dependent DNA helica